jgi:hypothetical protein
MAIYEIIAATILPTLSSPINATEKSLVKLKSTVAGL